MRKVFEIFVKARGGRPALVLICLMFAGVAGGVSIVGLLPMLALATGDLHKQSSGAANAIVGILGSVGLEAGFGTLTLIFLVSITLKALLVMAAMRIVGKASAQVANNLRIDLINSLLEVRWRFFTNQPIGRVTNAFTAEAGGCATAYLFAANFFSAAIQSSVSVTAAVLVSWRLALVALIFGGLTSLVLMSFVRLARRAGRKQTRVNREMAAYFMDGLSNIKALKAMGRQSRFKDFLERKIRSLRKAQSLAVTAQEVRRSLQEVLMATCLCGTLYVSLTVFAYPISEILVMAVLLSQTMRYLGQVQENYQRVAGVEGIHDSFHALLAETRAASERRSGGRPPTLNRGIRFEDVHFAYLERREVLRGANLEIPLGEVTVLTGPSGAGKTTITDLLLGFYDPDRGRVLIDGVPLSDIDIAAWRKMIGFVPQEIVLLHDSVYANVSLGDPKITRADAQDALERAGAWEFVSLMADGIMTHVGERGSQLSGGQRQRIALARALAQRPRLLILDEVTSALDPVTETAICDSVRRLGKDVAVLAINHRPAFLAIAERVYHLEGGRIEEFSGEFTGESMQTG